jgi:hypothetical protein
MSGNYAQAQPTVATVAPWVAQVPSLNQGDRQAPKESQQAEDLDQTEDQPKRSRRHVNRGEFRFAQAAGPPPPRPSRKAPTAPSLKSQIAGLTPDMPWAAIEGRALPTVIKAASRVEGDFDVYATTYNDKPVIIVNRKF